MNGTKLEELSVEAEELRIYEKSLYNAVDVLGNVDHTYGVMSEAVSQALDLLEKELKDVAKELESCADRAMELLYGEGSA